MPLAHFNHNRDPASTRRLTRKLPRLTPNASHSTNRGTRAVASGLRLIQDAQARSDRVSLVEVTPLGMEVQEEGAASIGTQPRATVRRGSFLLHEQRTIPRVLRVIRMTRARSRAACQPGTTSPQSEPDGTRNGVVPPADARHVHA